jgi:uncharacterized damage-inducible protein DinB
MLAMDTNTALLESWDRQARIVKAVAERVDESNKNAKPSEDGMPLYEQLAHIHLVRRFWLSQLDSERAAALGKSYLKGWQDPIDDLDQIRLLLDESALAIRQVMQGALETGEQEMGGYDHPVLFLQHMIWHEGWHVGLILLGLRLAGQEPPEEWEEANVWGEWRTE